MHRHALVRVGTLALLAMLTAAGCRASGHGAASAPGASPSPSRTTVAAGAADPKAYCDLFASLMPGLATRLAALDPTDKASMDAYWSQAAIDYQQMESVAPAEIRGDVDVFRQYASTRDDNLISQLPPAGKRINAYVIKACHIDPSTFTPGG